jgi:hypothetical protein
MPTADEALLRSAVGVLAYSVNQLIAEVGFLYAKTTGDPGDSKRIEELQALVASVCDSFPPPSSFN